MKLFTNASPKVPSRWILSDRPHTDAATYMYIHVSVMKLE